MRSKVLFVFLIGAVLLSGCRAVTKKFVRKKKYQKKEEVFVKPLEYPLSNNKELYIDYYVYARGWMKELIEALEDKDSEKKVLASCEGVLENLSHLGDFFEGNPEYKERLNFYISAFQEILDGFKVNKVNMFYWEKYLYQVRKLQRDFEKDFKVSRIFQ